MVKHATGNGIQADVRRICMEGGNKEGKIDIHTYISFSPSEPPFLYFLNKVLWIPR